MYTLRYLANYVHPTTTKNIASHANFASTFIPVEVNVAFSSTIALASGARTAEVIVDWSSAINVLSSVVLGEIAVSFSSGLAVTSVMEVKPAFDTAFDIASLFKVVDVFVRPSSAFAIRSRFRSVRGDLASGRYRR
mgnify:CR=1 FL=1